MSFKYHDAAFYITLIIILVLFISVLAILTVDIEVDKYSFGAEITNKEIYYYDNKVIYFICVIMILQLLKK